jgi:DNA modification methylase
MDINVIINSGAMAGLKSLEDKSIHCCVTSPPYFGLRDYDNPDQIGLEKTPEEFIQKLVEVFREVKRVLRDDGTLWLNIGDSYAGYHGNKNYSMGKDTPSETPGLKQKDLIGIPWMLAFALRADGWYLRQDIIWHKPNPMPESITDRCTKSHEYIFLLSKSKKYYYDQVSIMKPIAESSIGRLNQDILNQEGSARVPGKTNGKMKAVGGLKSLPEGQKNIRSARDEQRSVGKSGNLERKDRPGTPENTYSNQKGSVPWEGAMANKRSVWTVTTKPFKDAHFATFPEDLIVDCIKAGCPEHGIVLDVFMGAGTTAVVSRKLNRNYIGIELNKKYINISNKRLDSELGMFR